MNLPLQKLLRPRSAILVAAASMSLLGGCMTPDYHMPQGFSSSYHRALFGLPPVDLAMPPANVATADKGASGVFYPADVEYRLVERGPEYALAQPFVPYASATNRRSRY